MKLTANKILVMRYRFIGDTVLTVPFLRNLRKAYPAARIDLMLEPFSGQVLAGCPYVDRIIPFEYIRLYRNIERPEAIKKILHLMPVLPVRHRIGKQKRSPLGRKTNATRNAGRPDKQGARKRPFERECRVISLLPQQFPVMNITGKPAPL